MKPHGQGTKTVKDDGTGEKEEPAHEKVNWKPRMKAACKRVLLLYDETLYPTAKELFEYISKHHEKALDKYETPDRRLAYERMALNALTKLMKERSRKDK